MKAKDRELLAHLVRLGFAYEDACALRRISMTLSRWGELECGDGNDHASWCVIRDDETGKTFREVVPHHGKRYLTPIPDRETGALKRLAKIMARYPGFVPYHQTDPRGAALYVIPRDMLQPGDNVDSVYNRGIAIYAA